MDLRDRIADAIARGHDDTPATVHPCMEDYREHADKVMEVVEGEVRAAYTRGHADALEQAARVWEDGSPENDDYATAIRDLPLTHDSKEC